MKFPFRPRFALRLLLALGTIFADLAASEPVTSIRQVRALPHEEAVLPRNVELDAIILYHNPTKQEFFINDGTATCYASSTKEIQALQPGTRIRIKGQTTHFGLFPHIKIDSASEIGTGPVPQPYRPSPDELFAPKLDSRFVEIAAVVTGVEKRGLGYTLVVEIAGQTFMADVPPVPDADSRATSLMQRPVLMTGFIGTVFNKDLQMTGRHFFVASFDDIIPTSPPIDDPNAPLARIVDLLSARHPPDQLVSIEGTVTQNHQGGFYLSDESGSTRVDAALRSPLPAGTRVRAIGYAAIAPYRPILRSVSIETLDLTPTPLPSELPPLSALLNSPRWAAYQHQLVTVDVRLEGIRETTTATILQCRSGPRVFEALLEQPVAALDVQPGDHLRLTGICELFTSRPLARPEWIEGFRIILATPQSLIVTRSAPWWSARRLSIALLIAAGLALLAALLAAILRRQLSRQVAVVSRKIRDESISDERDRMARELHDTLEQQLTGLSLQIDGIDSAAKDSPEDLNRRVALAQHMIRHTRAEARRSVWDLRSHILRNEGLPAALAALASLPSEPIPAVVVETSRAPRSLPTTTSFQILRIAQEGVTNALKHANASHIFITLRETGENTELVVRDDGIGFDPVTSRTQELPHFGFIGMQERAARIGGTLSIDSAPGKGCSITLIFPTPDPNPPSPNP